MENKAITVNIPRWETDSLELICGIANAGGGYVLLPTSQKDYSSGLRRARRKFESIPDSITQGLGLTCPITPVMEGNEFFLEIDVPAALEPLGLHGVYWLYEDGVNTRQTYESISRSWRDEATTPWELKTLPYVEDEDLSGEALVAIAGIPLSNMDATSGTLTDTVKSRLDHLGLTHPRTGKVNNAAAVLLCANPARFVPGATVHISPTSTCRRSTPPWCFHYPQRNAAPLPCARRRGARRGPRVVVIARRRLRRPPVMERGGQHSRNAPWRQRTSST